MRKESRVQSAGFGLALAFWLALAFSAQAQWLTQSILVKPGWTAVYLHVDASYQVLDQLVGGDPNNPISEIWLWKPPTPPQFVTSPQNPTTPNSQWLTWTRLAVGGPNTLNSLIGNGAYLIHSTATNNFTWRIRGKPLGPDYSWTTSGLNFLGFPTAPTNAPMFDRFLALAPGLQSSAEIYQYLGGDLGPINPSRLFAFHTTPVTRGQAFWIRSGVTYNNYFGPFQTVLQRAGVTFGDSVSQSSFHLVNVTATNVTVTLRLLPSESPPAGQPVPVGVPPLLLRGPVNPTNLTYGYAALPAGGSMSWTLPPQGQAGSDVEVVLGVNRYAMSGAPGALFAGILQWTDSFGFTEVDAAVSAQVASNAGLWVGDATVTQVGNYLKLYQRDANNSLMVSSNGAYIVNSINTNLGPVAQPFPLRLILHSDGTNVQLLQRVFYGLSPATNLVLSTQESALDPAHLDTARRISAVHLPWSTANSPWPVTGQLAAGGTLTVSPSLAYDNQASNPFLHTYHPDHDNLDASFQTQLPQGYESYGVSRQITLQVNAPGNDFMSLTSAGQTYSGAYLETITLAGQNNTRSFNVSGLFSLKRISSIPTLLRP